MRRNIILATVVLLLSTGVVWAVDTVWDESNFTMEERKWQPAPTGHEVGKDNGTGGPGHHPEDDCGICHSPKGIASDRVFTLTATVYDNRAARLPVAGAEVIFQDYGGNVYSMTTNDLGIAWTDVAMEGDATQGDPTDTSTWRYKVWLLDEGGTHPMMTIPSLGNAMIPRMSCLMHHRNNGSLGGLWARPAPTLAKYPKKNLSYAKHIFPILRSKCGPCHKPGPSIANRGGEIFDYGADLDLVTYAGSSVELDGVVYVKRGVVDVINIKKPNKSLMLRKTVKGELHGGGSFWKRSDPDYKALRRWIKEGAADN